MINQIQWDFFIDILLNINESLERIASALERNNTDETGKSETT